VRKPLWAAVPGVFLLVGLDDSPTRWEPHPGWLSTLFAVIAAWCVTRWPSRRWLIASGVAAAAAYLFKQNTGVFILAAVLLWGAISPADRLKRVGVPLAAFVAATALWFIPLVTVLHGQLTHLGGFIGAVSQAGLFSPPEPSLAVPLVALVGGLAVGQRDPRIRWLVLAGTALLLTQYPRMDTLHLGWSAPLLLVVGAVALDRVRPTLAGLAVLGLVAVAAPTAIARLDYVQQPRAAIAGVEAPSQTVNDINGVLADIAQRTQSGEPIFVYPTSPLLYVLSNHPNPTRFDHLNPGAADARQVGEVQADLESTNVRLVVVSDFWRAVWGAPGANAPLEAWLEGRFVEVARHGPYRVMVARL
jgi:hypothetical protein